MAKKRSAALVVLAKSRGSCTAPKSAWQNPQEKSTELKLVDRLDRTEVLHQVAGERNLLESLSQTEFFGPKWCVLFLKNLRKLAGRGWPVMLLSMATWGERTRSTLSNHGDSKVTMVIHGHVAELAEFHFSSRNLALRGLRSPQRSSVIREFCKTLLDLLFD